MHDLFRKKYQEMMEPVEVSGEMRERILETLEQETNKNEGVRKSSKTAPVIYWKSICPLRRPWCLWWGWRLV